jgi:chromosomal replication initiator protein
LPYFLAGDENRLAAFVSIADDAALDIGNPLLLIGPSGAGKSALALHLAARLSRAQTVHASRSPANSEALLDVAAADEPAAVLYLTAVDFARAYADGVAADDLQPLRDEIHRAPVLVIDDLHLIRDKPPAQDELALRIDARTERNQPTILTCRRLPSEVRGIRPLLASRAVPGLTIPVAIAAGDARLQIVRELAVHHQLDLREELIQLLHQRIDSRLPARSLESAIKQIGLWCRMHDASPSIEAAEFAIEAVGKTEEISLAEITAAVAKYFRLKRTELRSSSRKQTLVRARSLAMLLGRRLTSLSMHQIGDYFGGRDHTTVLHAVRKTESLLEQETELRRAAEEIQEKLCSP